MTAILLKLVGFLLLFACGYAGTQGRYGIMWSLLIVFGVFAEFTGILLTGGTATSQYRLQQHHFFMAGVMMGFVFFLLEHFGLEARYPSIPSWWRIVASGIGFVLGAVWLKGKKKNDDVA